VADHRPDAGRQRQCEPADEFPAVVALRGRWTRCDGRLDARHVDHEVGIQRPDHPGLEPRRRPHVPARTERRADLFLVHADTVVHREDSSRGHLDPARQVLPLHARDVRPLPGGARRQCVRPRGDDRNLGAGTRHRDAHADRRHGARLGQAAGVGACGGASLRDPGVVHRRGPDRLALRRQRRGPHAPRSHDRPRRDDGQPRWRRPGQLPHHLDEREPGKRVGGALHLRRPRDRGPSRDDRAVHGHRGVAGLQPDLDAAQPPRLARRNLPLPLRAPGEPPDVWGHRRGAGPRGSLGGRVQGPQRPTPSRPSPAVRTSSR